MIGINPALIRAARRLSVDDEKIPTLPPTTVEDMLSRSPPRFPSIDTKLHTRPAKATPKRTLLAKGQSASSSNSKSNGKPHSLGTVSQHFKKVEVVPRAAAMSSSLSKQLERNLGSRLTSSRPGRFDASGGGAGGWVTMDVFTEVGHPPLKIKVQKSNTVEEVIGLILRQHAEAKREPPLRSDAEGYELRMLDDDDGTPDMDMPPLGRKGAISKIGILQAIALCPRESYTNLEWENAGNRSMRSVSLGLNQGKKFGSNDKMYIKVHMPNHVSHVLPIKPTMRLQEILPLIAKKRSSDDAELVPRNFKFCYRNETQAIEMSSTAGQLKSDELVLMPRVEKQFTLNAIPEADADEEVNIFFTPTLAHQYSEYPVIKTNQRGKKQTRILGIDGDKIYNRNPDNLQVLGRKISMDVRRAYRTIAEVAQVRALPDKRSFEIVFRGSANDKRLYQAETKMECAQICAKINFLIEEYARRSASANNVPMSGTM